MMFLQFAECGFRTAPGTPELGSPLRRSVWPKGRVGMPS